MTSLLKVAINYSECSENSWEILRKILMKGVERKRERAKGVWGSGLQMKCMCEGVCWFFERLKMGEKVTRK